MASLGERIRQLREESEMTGEQLGKKLNVSKQSISKWENDTSNPDIDTIRKIASIFNTTVDYLSGDSDIRNPYITEGIEIKEEQEKYNVTKLDDDISIWFSKDEYSDDLPEDVKNSMRDYLRFLLKEHGKKKNE